MHVLFCGIDDEAIEIVGLLLSVTGRRRFNTGCIEARPYSTGAAPNFNRSREWKTKPVFNMKLLKLSRINDMTSTFRFTLLAHVC